MPMLDDVCGEPFCRGNLMIADHFSDDPPRRRYSTRKGDPGELAYASAVADGCRLKVTLDGKPCDSCEVADEIEGYVIRPIRTDAGNLAFNDKTFEFVYETVHGDVRVVLEPK